MVIHKLSLKNFKPFTDISFTLNSQFNIIIGKNMSGKTSILDGLSVAMGAFFWGMSGGEKRNIKPNEIHLQTYTHNIEELTPTQVKATGVVSQKSIEWTRELTSLSGKTTRYGASALEKIAKEMNQKRQQNLPVDLPLLAYYPTDRDWKAIEKELNKQKKNTNLSRVDGYLLWDKPNNNIKTVLEWFKTMQLATMQPNGKEVTYKNSVELEVLRTCLLNCIENATNIYFDWKREELIIEWKDGRKIPVACLSHGVKNMMAIIADIAYRCLRLNPHLGLEAAQKTEGIVLIDELDAHLHPSWQLTIVDNLKKTFPKIQFVVTTHSPLIIGSADVGELIILPDNLSQGSFQPEEKSYKGWQLQFILEQLMDSASNYDVAIDPILEQLSNAFEAGNIDLYKKYLADLSNILNPNDAILKVYQMKLSQLL